MNTAPMPDSGGLTLTPFEDAIVHTEDRITPSEASATGDEDATAPSFAPRHSRRRAFQEAKVGAQRFRTRNGQARQAGRSPLLTHPIVLRDLPAHADARPSQTQLTKLHRSLTQRDLVILQSLYDYRYLNTLQLQELFFPSLRSCQIRLHQLKTLGLIYVWKVIETPGVRRRHSMCLISARAARVLADWHGDDQRAYVERSHEARDHSWHAVHDLEANQFFVSLVSGSRETRRQGLQIWSGEEQVREERRERAREIKQPIPTPDGRGIYRANGGRIFFDLEWDRATESLQRMRQKIASYVAYFKHYRDADKHHVLFVVPNDEREDSLQYETWRGRPSYSLDTCCSFWTTTSDRLRRSGPLGTIWLKVENRAEKPPPIGITRAGQRMAFRHLPPMDHNDRSTADCIGKPFWWERRPGGGQIA
jgi:hypothetical protein